MNWTKIENKGQQNSSISICKLTKKARETILALRQPLPLKDIAKQLNIKNYTALKRLQRLQEKGIVQKQIKTSITIYELTTLGRDICGQISIACKTQQKTIIRVHNLRFKSTITRQPVELIEKLKESNWFEVDHNSWRGYRKNIYDCLIEFTPRNIIFHIDQIVSSDAYTAHGKAITIVMRAKEYLENKYPGLVLGTPEKVATISRQHIASLYDPYAIKAKQNHFSGSTDRVEVDASKDTPELETIHPIHAVNDMQEILNFYDDIAKKGSPFSIIENLIIGERIITTLKIIARNKMELLASYEDNRTKQDFYYLLNYLNPSQQQRFISWFENFIGGKLEK